MSVLEKYKSNFDEGFKEFVKKMDMVNSKDLKELIASGLIEDPVYLKWALENKLGFEYFLKLNKDEVMKVFYALNEPDLVFLRALKNHPSEDNFVNANLPSLILTNYLEVRDSARVTVALQEDSRSKILEVIYDLKEAGKLSYHWRFPSAEILRGVGFEINNSNIFKQLYDSGAVAITGLVDSKQRRTGSWTHNYPNGALHAEGEYFEGKMQGPWKFYYLNGTLKSSGFYRQNFKHGPWEEAELNKESATINYTNGRISK